MNANCLAYWLHSLKSLFLKSSTEANMAIQIQCAAIPGNWVILVLLHKWNLQCTTQGHLFSTCLKHLKHNLLTIQLFHHRLSSGLAVTQDEIKMVDCLLCILYRRGETTQKVTTHTHTTQKKKKGYSFKLFLCFLFVGVHFKKKKLSCKQMCLLLSEL